jgi:hypothetical protein
MTCRGVLQKQQVRTKVQGNDVLAFEYILKYAESLCTILCSQMFAQACVTNNRCMVFAKIISAHMKKKSRRLGVFEHVMHGQSGIHISICTCMHTYKKLGQIWKVDMMVPWYHSLAPVTSALESAF